MHDSQRPEVARRHPLPPLSRRTLLAGIASGVGLGFAGAATSAAASPSPTLPGEYTRTANVVTQYSGTLYDNIVVKIKGDPARLFVPQSIKPGQATPIRVVWLFHGAGSDHNALNGGFKTTGERIVDAGCIAICQNAGGTLYSSPTARTIQGNGYAWMAGIYTVGTNVLRATSGGGALACETLGSGLIPNIAGMYNVNAVYDLMAMYNQGGDNKASVVAVFGDDPAAIGASSPARLPGGAWTGKNLRIVVSQPNDSDRIVPPEQHGLALLNVAQPTAAEASLRTHANGHNTPGFADLDFMAALSRWAPPYASSSDSTPPTVTITAPTAGAALTGTSTLSATASDDVGVTGVTFVLAGKGIPASLVNGVWRASLDSTLFANGGYSLTANATDAAGNSGTSAAVAVTVANTDSVPPMVAIETPTPGSVVSGRTTLVASASDDVGISKVVFSANGLNLLASQVNGKWQAVFDTTVLADGSYALTAIATDRAGNSTTSSVVPITVRNKDLTPPSVSVTSPTAGSALSGTTTFTATASDDVAVTAVTFAIGGTTTPATAAGGAWSATFDTTALPNGSYSLTATATDAAANMTTSAAVAVVVKNADTKPPVVAITAPANGATVSKTVTATATATDDVGVTGVSFYLGTRLIGPATLSGGVWSLTFNTKTSVSPNGSYTIVAKATDAAGNVGTSAPVAITIKN